MKKRPMPKTRMRCRGPYPEKVDLSFDSEVAVARPHPKEEMERIISLLFAIFVFAGFMVTFARAEDAKTANSKYSYNFQVDDKEEDLYQSRSEQNDGTVSFIRLL